MKKSVLVGIVIVLFYALDVQADPLISRKDAHRLLGDLESYFSQQPYTVFVLFRKKHQPIHLDPIDAILFHPGRASVKKIRSRDRDHRLLLNSPVGRPGEWLTPVLLKRLLNLIKYNHMIPYVLESEGEERVVVFTDPYNHCAMIRTPKGIRVFIESGPFHHQKTLEERAIWFRKY